MKFLYFCLSLFATTLAIKFNCQFERITWNLIGSSYSCLTVPTNINKNQTLTGVTGNHHPDNSNVNVTLLLIYDCSAVTFVPQGIHSFFPNIAGLIMDSCNISTLNGNELNDYNHLQWISLASNNIAHIPGDLFSQNSNIRFAHFHNNVINSVGENLLISLESFQQAHFWDNLCINDAASNVASIPLLIANLRDNCAIPEDTTTLPSTTTATTSSTTTSSTGEPTCHINETICELKIQNENLEQQNAEMREKLDYLSEKMDTVMELIVELSTRPCGS